MGKIKCKKISLIESKIIENNMNNYLYQAVIKLNFLLSCEVWINVTSTTNIYKLETIIAALNKIDKKLFNWSYYYGNFTSNSPISYGHKDWEAFIKVISDGIESNGLKIKFIKPNNTFLPFSWD